MYDCEFPFPYLMLRTFLNSGRLLYFHVAIYVISWQISLIWAKIDPFCSKWESEELSPAKERYEKGPRQSDIPVPPFKVSAPKYSMQSLSVERKKMKFDQHHSCLCLFECIFYAESKYGNENPNFKQFWKGLKILHCRLHSTSTEYLVVSFFEK